MGEILSMGIPIITNTGIGDVENIINESQCGILISDFNDSSYQNATHELLEKNHVISKNTKHTAHNYFSLLDGIEKYNHVYSSFTIK
jgi:glycosyltransferase involved in cell wall biosynthesis